MWVSQIPDRTQEEGRDNINSKLARKRSSRIYMEVFGSLPANDLRRESKARLSLKGASTIGHRRYYCSFLHMEERRK